MTEEIRDGRGRIVPGKSLNPAGREKGVPNKITKELNEMTTEALNRAGANIQKKRKGLSDLDAGTAYLVEQAEKRPDLFMSLIRQMLPTKVSLDVQMLGQELLTVMTERRNQLAHLREINPDKETTNEDA